MNHHFQVLIIFLNPGLLKYIIMPVNANEQIIGETNFFIFYLVIVCKLLLVLFKDKNFDNNEYEEEFRSIFDPNNIRHRLKEMYRLIFIID